MRLRMLIVLGIALLMPSQAFVKADDPISGTAKVVRHTYRALFEKKPPLAGRDPGVEDLAKEIDWLEHLIESYGSAVPKHPDVWGEARLTKHRFDYEREIAKRFNSDVFKETLQASVLRTNGT